MTCIKHEFLFKLVYLRFHFCLNISCFLCLNFDPYGPQLSGEAAEVTKKHVALTADEVQSDLGKLKNSTLHHAKDGMKPKPGCLG